jgi:hypothetical protein
LEHYWGPYQDNWGVDATDQGAPAPFAGTTVRSGPDIIGQAIAPFQAVRGHAVVGNGYRWDNRQGRLSIRTFAAVGGGAPGIGGANAVQPASQMLWDPAGNNPGARTAAPNVVQVWDIHTFLSGGAGPAFPVGASNDTTSPLFFIPSDNLDLLPNASSYILPAASVNGGGFGIFINDDGAGVARYEYVAWVGGVLFERVVVPLALVPDLTRWSTFRFVLVSAFGLNATMRLEVNGTTLIEREFDGIVLPRPVDCNPDAIGWLPAHEMGSPWGGTTPAAGGMNLAWNWYFGRFTPTGVEVMPL